MKSHKGKQIYNLWCDKMKKYLRDLRKLFKYQHSQWLRNNENIFSKTKKFFKRNKN